MRFDEIMRNGEEIQMERPIVQFQQVTKKYPGTEALKDATFDLPRGKIIGIVGPNGSGKSTSLKLMAGLLQPDRGTVFVDGEKVNRLIARKVAFLHETDQLYGFYKVRDIIDYYSNIYEDFDKGKAREMLQFLQLDPAQKIGSLSKGNRMRVKLVLVLSRNAPLLLLDEPLSGLDPMVRESIIKGLISFLDMKQQTVVLTTHEVDEVEPLLDIVAALKDGTVYKVEEADVIRSEYGMSLINWMKQVYALHRH